MGQIKSGTAIVVFYSKQRVVLAGDSRVVLAGKSVSSRDDECKIFALDNRFLDAKSGIVGHDYLPGETGQPWSGQEEASRIAASMPKGVPDGAAILARRWGEWMRAKLDRELTINEAMTLSHLRNNRISSAVFSGRAQTGELSVHSVVLNCACTETPKRAILQVDKQKPTADNLPVAFLGPREGLTVFNEVLDGNTERAKAERAAWTTSLPKANSLIHDAGVTIRTLKFVIRYSGTPDIGGPIDAVALDSNGKIEWIQRKPNCSENN